MRVVIAIAVILLSTGQLWSQNVESFGLIVGLNSPITIDEGLQKDPRYFGQFTLRASPIGFSYGIDKLGYGYLITPSYLQIGQKYNIKNTIGGEIGTRDIQMDYISVPIALKLHINDLAFFRLSAVAALNFNYLVSGKEIVSYSSAKVRFPSGVSVPTTPGYIVAYDGVFVPDVDNEVYVSTDKFNAFQLFAGLGLHSDFDLNDNWSLNFDGRINFGIFDPRQTSYIDQLKKPSGGPDINNLPGAPDLYGQRREVYLSVNFGLSYIIQSQAKQKIKKTTIKDRSGNKGMPKSRNKKPR
ncbi:MAG: outer membrane beta-barrel protein [Cyclobacteriaceae bacterium]|nr:outer membrane beta-barrel protein [Cyclobacteriaceae bacterium]